MWILIGIGVCLITLAFFIIASDVERLAQQNRDMALDIILLNKQIRELQS